MDTPLVLILHYIILFSINIFFYYHSDNGIIKLLNRVI